MVVRTPPPPGINDAPLGFDEAVRAALAGRFRACHRRDRRRSRRRAALFAGARAS